MLDPTVSGCINHPGVEAVARCKQCNTPVCGMCVVKGPNGRFCSDACRDQYKQFVERAQNMHTRRRSRLGTVVKRLVVVVAVVVAIGVVASFVPIPVLSGLVWRLRGMFGI